MTDRKEEMVPASTKVETALDVAAVVSSAAPWIGGPVSSVLSGMSFGRKLGRVRQVLEAVATDLKDFKSEASEEYVKTEEFEDLLEQTLKRVGEERNEEKRHLYKSFLTDAIESPAKDYDDQLGLLRTFEELGPDDIQILKALAQEPRFDPTMLSGSPIQTLRMRVPHFEEERITVVVGRLNNLRMTNLTSLRVMMTAGGAADLRGSITGYGRKILKYIVEA
jgi:hypothetical protein